MHEQSTATPSGICKCGCGEPTPLATKTSTRDGTVKGQPLRYARGHAGRGKRQPGAPKWKRRGVGVPRVCDACGADFHTTKSHLARGWGRFCSVFCERKSRPTRPIAERLWAKITQDGPVPDYRPDLGPCWPWTGPIDKKTRYGMFEHSTAHRWAYIVTYGDPGAELQIDHLCKVRHCCRPSHLEAVTPKVNMERGMRAQQTHCLRGHEFNAENTRIDGTQGTRHCKACKRREPVPRPNVCRRGHEFTPENTVDEGDGRRRCRTCRHDRAHERHLEKYQPRERLPETVCRRAGHPFTPENTVTNADGSRKCRTCYNASMREWRQRQRDHLTTT